MFNDQQEKKVKRVDLETWVKIRIFQKGFNFSQDGPGNRLVYHLQGCNMRCLWCANPEGIAAKGSLMVRNELLADNLCPHGAIKDRQIDRTQCVKCTTRECLHKNKSLGIRLSSQEVELESIVDEARRSAPLYFGGGGITLSGGEPTLQFGEVRTLLSRLQEAGIHTTMETNATHPKLPELFPLIDFLIMDYKHYDSAVLKRVTGVGNAVINRNLAKSFASQKPMLVRIPLIGGVNDSATDIEHFTNYFTQFDTERTQFEFLLFHEFGKNKWEQCGLPYQCDKNFVDPTTLDAFQKAFKANNLTVVHT